MPSPLNLNLTEDAIIKLIRAGLEKDIAKFVSEELIRVSTETIKVAIKAHVEQVVKTFSQSVVSINSDLQSDRVIINVMLK